MRVRRIAARPLYLRILRASLGLMVVIYIMPAILGYGIPDQVWHPIVLGAILVIAVFGLSSEFHEGPRWFRLLDRLEQENDLVCPDCYHALADHIEHGRCPECEYAFTARSLAQDWWDVKKLLRLKVTESPRRQKALARKRRLSPMSGYVGLVPLVFVTVLLLFDVSVNRLGAPWLGGFLSLCVLALLGLIGAGFVWGLLRRRRFFRRLEKRDFLVCPDCHYSLVAHAAGGRCPECGYAFTPESLLQDWRDVRTVLWTDLRE